MDLDGFSMDAYSGIARGFQQLFLDWGFPINTFDIMINVFAYSILKGDPRWDES